MRLVFLGTGTSYGVPQIGCDCRTCTSSDPRDRRTRTAALIESGGRRLLIDTPPELRLQLVTTGIGSVDAVLFTHAHADHVHGIDDSARRISYSVVESPMSNMESHQATIAVDPEGSGSHVTWSVEVAPDELLGLFVPVYEGSVVELKKKLEG